MVSQAHDSPPSPLADDINGGTWEHVEAPGQRSSEPPTNRPNQVEKSSASSPPHMGHEGSATTETDRNVGKGAPRVGHDADEEGKEQKAPDSLATDTSKAATDSLLRRKPVAVTNNDSFPNDAFSKLDMNEAGPGANPWQQSTGGQGAAGPSTPTSIPQPRPVTAGDLESDPWAVDEKKDPSAKQALPRVSPALTSMNPQVQQGAVWEEERASGNDGNEMVLDPPFVAVSGELVEEQNAWDDVGAVDKGKGTLPDASATGPPAALAEDWNWVGDGPSASSSKLQQAAAEDEDKKPPLPARSSAGLQQKWKPSRPPVDAKAETYQIKNVKWQDAKAAEKRLRTSPILIQNENGPCPLVALVNALTMTAPTEGPESSLADVLRSREQISLDLLLNAVFDELMSPTRTDSENALPDVSDLYAFLQSLHTGMNVNPRFVPSPEMVDAYRRTPLTHLEPHERGHLIPGTFENTMEMSLYATFSVPLIHGWLPAREEAVYGAMERRAASYEDVQNLLFGEEELEEQLLRGGGLKEDEQQLYQDIATIKMFLNSSATQLTAWGIEVIRRAMRPGTFAILFRNDHFSTLYCHPQSLQLFSLVTDAGYRTHDEVVWETLVDVNGKQTEYLSGDFRVVSSRGGDDAGLGPGAESGSGSGSGAGPARPNSFYDVNDEGNWTTVGGKRGKNRQEEPAAGNSVPQHEQEDRDLALALQLQEEEDQRHQEEQSRRRRESILSEQYIEQQGHRPSPVNRDPRSRDRRTTAQTPQAPQTPQTPQTSGIAPERRSSNAFAIPVTISGNSGPRQPGASSPSQGFPSQQQQRQQEQHQFRSLVPPRRPGVGVVRAAETNGQEAPPSYEQAAQDPAYVPPVGHPNHSQSRVTQAGTGATTTGHVQSEQSASGPLSPGSQTGRRHGSASGGRERDCVVM